MKMKLTMMLMLFWITGMAQPQNSGSIKELKVGDTFPVSMELGKLINASKPGMKLSDSKADLIILDFWATWCQPCREFFKTTEKLEKEFNGKVQFIPITSEKEEIASKYLKDREKVEKDLPISIVEDEVLRQFFPHTSIPHEIWLDKNGIVKAITGYVEVSNTNIRKFLDEKDLSLKVKADPKIRDVDYGKPCYMGNQIDAFKPGEGLEYYSIFSKYDPGVVSGQFFSLHKVTCFNSSAIWLCRLAFGKAAPEFMGGDGRIIVEVKDTVSIGRLPEDLDYRDWAKQNTYCYELNVGDTSNYSAIGKYDIMQRDVNNFLRVKFGVEGKLEKRKGMCWSLVRLSKLDKLKTKGIYAPVEASDYGFSMKNHSLMDLMIKMGHFRQLSPIPLIDNTGYTGKVDLELNCDLGGDMSKINAELKKYDLAFVKKEMLLDMIVISDVKKGK